MYSPWPVFHVNGKFALVETLNRHGTMVMRDRWRTEYFWEDIRNNGVTVAVIIGGAFGWRAIARELAGKIPLGGGLIPKGAIAYAGTYAVGASLKRYHLHGIKLTLSERRQAYQAALERGRRVVGGLISGLRGHRAA